MSQLHSMSLVLLLFLLTLTTAHLPGRLGRPSPPGSHVQGPRGNNSPREATPQKKRTPVHSPSVRSNHPVPDSNETITLGGEDLVFINTGDHVNPWKISQKASLGENQEFGPYYIQIDTGSWSFWVPAANFECVDVNATVIPQSACKFPGNSSTWYNQNTSTDYFQYDHAPNHYSYGDGEFFDAYYGLEQFSTATHNTTLEIQPAYSIYWFGDHLNYGLIGWSMCEWTDPRNFSSGFHNLLYPYKLMIEHELPHIWSWTLDLGDGGRESNFSGAVEVRLGGVVEKKLRRDEEGTRIPINSALFNDNYIYYWYQFDVQDFNYTSSNNLISCNLTHQIGAPSNNTAYNACETTGLSGDIPQGIFDTGTVQIYAPHAIAEEYMALWGDDVLGKDEVYGLWEV